MKIAIIGAGGQVFPLRLVADILSHSALQGSTISLMDISPERLGVTVSNARRLVEHHQLPAQIESTGDQREAVRGADAVIVTFQVGGLDAYRLDVEIPRTYGLDQTVGDTLGPGGVMRFLRSVPAYERLAHDMQELCPDALLLNYANPMAMSCWYLASFGLKVVGLCHSVQGTTHMLAQALSIPSEELSYRSAGINHQAWLLELRHHGQDVYPELRRVMAERHLQPSPDPASAAMSGDDGYHSELAYNPSVYEGGQERVRTSVMEYFGYFHTESSHHASEYLPYFRKDAQATLEAIPQRWDYYDICCRRDGDDQHGMLVGLLEELRPSIEYGATILNALATDVPAVIYGNVPNTGLIPNLPQGCCVEVACLVDGTGVHPTAPGALPPQLAALNRTNINVQELAVQAALTGDVQHVYHAVALDPLTAALLTLPQIRAMTTELLRAEAGWLPDSLKPALPGALVTR